MARLVGGVAVLTAAGPAPAGTLSATERSAALTARDVVADELRNLSGALLRLGPRGVRGDLRLIVTSPAHALHVALTGLSPVAGADRLPALDALAVGGGALLRAWQDAARGAVALEAYHPVLAAQTTAADAWLVARDLAEVAATLPYLDADLAAALPAGIDPARTGLLEPVAHRLVRLAADELRAQTADLPTATASVVRLERPRVRPVRTVGELPEATRHLTRLAAGRGKELTALEARAIARALTEGFDLTARVLPAASRGEAAGAAAVGHLSAAASDLQQIMHGQVATLTPPASAVLFLSQQIRERLTAVAGLVDRLDRDTSPKAREGLPRIATAMSEWAVEAIDAAATLRDGLHAAAATGKLLVPRQDLPRGAGHRYLWVSVPPATADQQPVVAAAARAAATLSAARGPLTQIAGPLAGADRTAARRVAFTAAAARGQLRATVRTRTHGELPQAARRPHPSSLPDVGVALSLGS